MFNNEAFESEIRRYMAYLEIERGLSRNTVISYSTELEKFKEFLSGRNLDYLKAGESDIIEFIPAAFKATFYDGKQTT